MTETAYQTEIEAALEEGIAPMPEDLIPLRDEMKALKAQLEVMKAREQEIKDTFGKRLAEAGLKGYLLHGKVHARISFGTRTTVDSKELKEKMPHIWQQFLKVTKYTSVRVD